MRFVVGIVVVLHGLVHLLYFAQSQRFFELQSGMLWPDGSWAFSKLLGLDASRWLAGIACVLAALGFVAAGAGVLLAQAWWRPVIVGSAIFSAAVFAFFWNGRAQNLDDQGLFAILINAAMLISVLVFQWPDLGF